MCHQQQTTQCVDNSKTACSKDQTGDPSHCRRQLLGPVISTLSLPRHFLPTVPLSPSRLRRTRTWKEIKEGWLHENLVNRAHSRPSPSLARKRMNGNTKEGLARLSRIHERRGLPAGMIKVSILFSPTISFLTTVTQRRKLAEWQCWWQKSMGR